MIKLWLLLQLMQKSKCFVYRRNIEKNKLLCGVQYSTVAVLGIGYPDTYLRVVGWVPDPNGGYLGRYPDS
jgi:hypothetical protein